MTDPTPSKPTSDLDALLEAEIEAALGDISLEEMVDLPHSPQLGKTHAPGSATPAGAAQSAAPGAPASASRAPAPRAGSRDRQRGDASDRGGWGVGANRTRRLLRNDQRRGGHGAWRQC